MIPLYSGQREASRKAASSQSTLPSSHRYGGASCLAKRARNAREEGVPARASEPGWPRVNLAYMQDKRRRNDFASTEVGEVKGGRVTQQAFEVADKKDSGIKNSAMPGMRGDERKDAHENPAPRKRACPRFLPRSFDFKKGHGEKPGKQGITQAQRLKIFSTMLFADWVMQLRHA